jgi:uncharacterized protein (TIGR03067 family)
MLRAVISVFALVALTAVATAAENDLDKLHGTWIVVSAELDGSAESCDLKKGDKLVFDGTKYKFEAKHFPESGTFSLEPKAKPKEIDFLDTKDKKSHGIYELNGEQLKLCFADSERPKQFKSSKVAMLVNLKLEKK